MPVGGRGRGRGAGHLEQSRREPRRALRIVYLRDPGIEWRQVIPPALCRNKLAGHEEDPHSSSDQDDAPEYQEGRGVESAA